jgi:hypothetical protein
VHEGELHLVALELLERLGQRFERTLHVGLEHEVEGRDLARLSMGEDVLQLGAAAIPRRSSDLRQAAPATGRRPLLVDELWLLVGKPRKLP